MDLSRVSERNQAIFAQIVETYLTTGSPVGSKTISKSAGVELSPASIRNVMADLEASGLLEAPHTSAGRIPTDMGLRLFVDGLMQVGALSKEEQQSIRKGCKTIDRSVEDMLMEASKALSGLSNCASLVLVPKEDMIIRHMEFVPLSADRAMVILVGGDGMVENRIVEIPKGLPTSSLIQAGNFLSTHLAGKSLSDAYKVVSEELLKKRTELDELTAPLIEKGLALWSGNMVEEPSLIVSGQSKLLEGARESEDLSRIQLVFDELERKKNLVQMLEMVRGGRGVKLFIGSENNLFSLTGSSLVLAPYMKDENTVVGVIGVIGPTRLNYARIIPMVDYTAKVVGRLF